MSVDTRCVLVGTDGSWRSGPVLDVAAEEASNRGLPLLIVSAMRSVPDPRHADTQRIGDDGRAHELTDWRLLEAVSRVRGIHPALDISSHRLTDADLPWRLDGTAGLPEPALLVIGARGPRDQAFGLGTVSRDLLQATSCPVLVVPESAHRWLANPASRADAVVAGLADDPLSGHVLRAAADEATLRRVPVEVVHSYSAAYGESETDACSRAAARCDELIGTAREADERWKVIRFTVVVTTEPAPDVLRRRSATASMVVLGTRGASALAGLSLKSVSRAVVGNARCPVLLVVPGTGSRTTSPLGIRPDQDVALPR